MEKALSEINDKIGSIQSELNNSAKAPVTQHQSVLSYSDILKNKTQPAVIVLPKNSDQSVSRTKSDINLNIRPSESNIQLSRVKTLKNGGVLIGCKNSEDNNKIKNLVQEKLSDSYEVKEVRGVDPRIRIVGMSETYPEDQLVEYIQKCNSDILGKSVCKLIKFSATRKNKNIYQCVIQLDRYSYDKVIKAGNLFVGFDSCSVYDAVDPFRCYKCNEFNHSSSKCSKALSCPLCGGSHDVKQCSAQVFHCTNCAKLKNLENANISTDHAVWDKANCTAYFRARDKLRADILSVVTTQ